MSDTEFTPITGAIPTMQANDGTQYVAINPEDREQVERLVKACPDDWAFQQDVETLTDCVDQMQAALRSLIAPPKPEEPTGLGAVVEDIHGDFWVYTGTRNDGDRRLWSHGRHDISTWACLNVARVLSEGVQS